MATRRFKVSPGEGEFAVTEEAGAAVNSGIVELTIEFATTAINVGGSTRGINKQEALDCVMKIYNHILKAATFPQ
jgi:hypothetical protein